MVPRLGEQRWPGAGLDLRSGGRHQIIDHLSGRDDGHVLRQDAEHILGLIVRN